MRTSQLNITRIRTVAGTLRELNQEVVFVGGATVSLYTDNAAAEARPTDDVDIIVELATYNSYAELEERLRSVGFVNDIESGIICRYIIKGVTVDILPTVPDSLGFSNKWYPEAFNHAIQVQIAEDTSIRIFSTPYFIASKIEAFKGRGENNYRFSTDFEDIVFVLENSMNIEKELRSAPEHLKQYFATEFSLWMNDSDFHEGLICHLSPYTATLQTKRITDILSEVIRLV